MSELIQPALDRLRKTFKTGKTKTASWRKEQLRQLQKGISDMRIQMQAAIERDLGRSPFVTEIFSIKPCEWNITHCLSHIDEFMKDVVLDTPLRLAPGRTKIKYEPLGVCLIFGSWNYPYIVTLKPLCQAIAAGNCAVIKPSEMSPNTSRVMKDLIENYLDKESFAVIEGDPTVAGEITKYPWDLICFTGSTQKGKMVAEAAAKNLVPCILELGGKCPAIVDASADADFAASKICFARFGNSGQTCLATDYVICHESQVQLLITRLKHHVKTMFQDDPNGSPDMGKIVTDWHCDRLKKMIETSGGELICGGGVKKNIKYVEPTIILNPRMDSEVMQEEVFGPILPIITFSDIGQAIDIINEKDKPLAVYYFGRSAWNQNRDRVMNETSSGAFCVNEAVSHIVNHSFGFGGVGASGYGRYGGYEGYKQFSNAKSIMIKPSTNFWPYTQLTPPYTDSKKRLVNQLIASEGTQWGVIRGLLILILLGFLIYVAFHWTTWVYQPIQGVCKNHFA